VTLAPVENWYLAKGVEGPKYTVGPRCANPECEHFADHAHHIFRRSMLAGDFHWVEVDGKTFGNLTGLCWRCHDKVTGNVGGHQARIWLELERGLFLWQRYSPHGNTVFQNVGPLDPQPPTSLVSNGESSAQESEHCPFCGQTRRRRGTAGPKPRRRRKTWNVSVPDDAEDGADILDTFVDDIALILGAGDWHERNRRYWALIHALAWTMQQREQFARDVKAAA